MNQAHLRPFRDLFCSFSALLACGVTLAACSDDAAPAADAQLDGARYALLTRVTDASSTRTDYVLVADSLDAEAGKLGLERASELPAGARLFAAERAGSFFIEDIPSLRKFEVSEQGALSEVGQLDFSQHGITDQGNAYVMVIHETKAYLISNSAFKVVVFNPSTMEITGQFPIDLGTEEYPIRFSFGEPVRRGDQLIFSTWISDTSTELVSDVSHVIVLDTAQDRVAKVSRDSRCGGLINVLPAANGNVYFFPDVWTAAIHRLGETRAPSSCMLRLKPGALEPDPEFAKPLSDFTGSKYTAGALAAGGNSFYLFTLDEAAAGITATTTAQTLHSGPWWRWVRVDIEQEGQGTPGELLGGTHYGWRLHERDYTYTSNEDSTESTVLRVDLPGAPQRGVVVPGVLNKAIALR